MELFESRHIGVSHSVQWSVLCNNFIGVLYAILLLLPNVSQICSFWDLAGHCQHSVFRNTRYVPVVQNFLTCCRFFVIQRHLIGTPWSLVIYSSCQRSTFYQIIVVQMYASCIVSSQEWCQIYEGHNELRRFHLLLKRNDSGLNCSWKSPCSLFFPANDIQIYCYRIYLLCRYHIRVLYTCCALKCSKYFLDVKYVISTLHINWLIMLS